MFQTRIHGRGGQGVVTAAELLSVAAFNAGRYAQAFPNFGSERTGAPVVAYCRIDDQPIRTREPITVPDALVILDVTLLGQIDLLSGLPASGYVIINTGKTLDQLGLGEFGLSNDSARLATVPATEIAMRLVGKPKPNAAVLGGLAALTGVIDLAHVSDAIRERFPDRLANMNIEAATEAFQWVSSQPRSSVDA